MIHSFSNSIPSKRNVYFLPTQQGSGAASTKSQGRASFNFHDSLQEDVATLEIGKRTNKQLFNSTTFDHNVTGGERLVLNGNQLMSSEQNQLLFKSNQPIKKKSLQNLQQQISPKYQQYNQLNNSQVSKSQLNFFLPSMKNQDSLPNNENISKDSKPYQLQDEISFNQIMSLQPNSDPNRLQRIQSLKKQNQFGSKTQRIEPKYIYDDKHFSQDQATTLKSSHIKNNSFENKNLLQSMRNQSSSQLYQVHEIIPIYEDYNFVAKPEQDNKLLNLGNPLSNQFQSRKLFNPKSKLFQENINPHSMNSSNKTVPLLTELKNNGIDYTDIIPHQTPSERMNKIDDISISKKYSREQNLKNILKNLNENLNNTSIQVYSNSSYKIGKIDESSSRTNQLINKSKLESEIKGNGNEFKSLKNKKQFLQQKLINEYQINDDDDNQKNNLYNGVRKEPSSHQFIAIKDNLKETKSKSSMNYLQLPIIEVQETNFEQKQKTLRNSFACSQNQYQNLTNRRQVSNGESRYIEQNLNISQENLKDQKIITNKVLQQKKNSLQNSIRTYQKQIEQPEQIIENNSNNVEQSASILLHETKNTKKNSQNNNVLLKQEINKVQSGNEVIIQDKQKSAYPNSQCVPYNTTYYQKELVLKIDKENTLQRKLKIYLDFQRIINFSNNMTLQSPQVTGIKIYKAYITKGNNGSLIRAALKNRWWWSLSDSSDEYDNINFLWTQWRKPQFFKVIKNREELTLSIIKNEDNEELKDIDIYSSQQNETSCQIKQCLHNKLETLDEIEVIRAHNKIQSSIQLGNQNSFLCKSDQILDKIQRNSLLESNFTDEIEFNKERQKKQNLSISTNDRPGYNDASPTRNLQDYMIKFQSIFKKQNQNSSPSSRKQSQQLLQQDPFSKIAALVNEKDLEKIKKYVKIQKIKKQLPKDFYIPPIFNKEEYEDGIEQEYKKIRQGCKAQINVFKDPTKQKMHNHMEYNFHLSNKKALYYNMKSYYGLINKNIFDHLPVTFHIQNGFNDPEFHSFVQYFNKFEIENPKRKNVWIIKPGESSNRGNGIQVAGNLDSIKDIIKVNESHQNGFKKTYIIQKYIDRPFLYNKRKFDIRCFMLMTNYNNNMKVYWYTEGYIRTSTKEFTLKNLENRMIHLTNEAVQKRGEDFGKYENGNKLSYGEFQKYIDANYPKENYNFIQQVYPQMKQLAYDSVCSVYTKIDKKKRNFSFELFGLDFMIDENFKTWLIEINTNPSLTIAAPLMSRILPSLIDNVLKIAIDPIFPPPSFPKSKKHLIPEQIYENNKFELLFDSDVDGERISQLYQNISQKIDEQLEEDCKNEEVYDDDDADIDSSDNLEKGC